MSRCLYCLDEKLVNPVCLRCRTILESVQRKLKALEKEYAVLRRQYWRLMREKNKK